jgi:hypothetical protein
VTWHLEQETVRRYQSGVIDRVGSASVEAHLKSCAECRSLLAVDEEWVDRSWMGIADRVEPGRPGSAERVLTLVGVPGWMARLVSVSPALRMPFLLALLLVTGFAVAASNSNPANDTYRIFLMVAPLLPVAGVAVAYGRLVDPAFEMTMVTPVNTLRLLMIRAATVLTVAICLGLISWPLVPAPTSVGASAWLIPSLGLTLATLALASRFEMWLSGAVVGGGWVAAILLASSGDIDFFAPDSQLVHAVLVGLSAVVVLLRRTSYDREGGGR